MAAALVRFFRELRRRRVIGVVVAYILVGWPIMEVSSFLEDTFELPVWFDRLVTLLIIMGFPLTVVLAWVFDITPRGIEVTDTREPQNSETANPTPLDRSPRALPPNENSVASVCVLPFDNLSEGSGHDSFAEGLATEIHSTLNRMHRVRVASRRSAFSFRGKETPIHEVAAALNVRYVLSGSLMRAGNRIRVIAELDDAETGSQLWSERYERELDDIFLVQSEISDAIVATFGAERQRDELAHAQAVSAENLDAWSMVQRARHYILDYSEHSLNEAYKLLKKSVAMDQNYAAARAALGSVLCERVINGFSEDIASERREAHASMSRARELAPHDPFVLKMSGLVAIHCGDVEGSLRTLRKCVALAPYDYGAWGYFGWPLAARATEKDLGELTEILDRLFSNAADHPGSGYWHYHRSAAHLLMRDFDAAEHSIRQALEKHPEVSWAWVHLASVLGAQGKTDDAKAACAEALRINPAMTAQHFADCLTAMSGPNEPKDERFAGLTLAGILEPRLEA